MFKNVNYEKKLTYICLNKNDFVILTWQYTFSLRGLSILLYFLRTISIKKNMVGFFLNLKKML